MTRTHFRAEMNIIYGTFFRPRPGNEGSQKRACGFGLGTSNTSHKTHRTFPCTFWPLVHRLPLRFCPHMRLFRRVLNSEDCYSVLYISVTLCFRGLCGHDLENCQICASLSSAPRAKNPTYVTLRPTMQLKKKIVCWTTQKRAQEYRISS